MAKVKQESMQRPGPKGLRRAADNLPEGTSVAVRGETLMGYFGADLLERFTQARTRIRRGG